MRCKGGRAGRNPTEEHCPPARLAPPREFQSPTSGLAMTLEQLNIVLQLVGTLGVIASLIFVGLQVRQNTKAARVQVQENMTSGYISVAAVLIEHAEVFTRGIAATHESFAAFSDADK